MKLSAIKPISRVLASELAVTALLLFGVSVVVFAILYLAPGDPLNVLLEGQSPRSELALGMREALGVPRTWYGQYAAWFGKMLQGNFGNSIRTGLPVVPELARVGVNTLYLTLGSLVLTLLIAVPIAVHTAAHGDTAGNTAATIGAYILSAVPVFWFGYIVVYVFIHKFGMFPLISGTATKQAQAWLYFLVPIFVLGTASGTLSEVIRHLREELSRVLAEDYIRTARAKGALVWRHAFKEGFLIPVTEIVSAKIPFLLGGAVIVEQVFNWPGMGRMAWQAAQNRDYPAIMGIAPVCAAVLRLGTDFLGRDLQARLILGIQAYFLPGLLAITISVVAGSVLGILAGYRGGWSDTIITYFDNLLDSFPRLVLILLVIASFKPDIYYVMVVVGITGMPVIANLIAGKIAFLRQTNFIEAAHALGLPAHTVILKHILWFNCRAALVIQATLGMGEAILVETSLSYLGFGVQEPTPSWGNMVQAGANYFLQGNFWPSTAPALAILATILGFQLLGDGLNNLLEGKRGK